MKRILGGAAIGAVLLSGTIGMSAVAAAPAFADGTTPTSMTVTGNQPALVTGKPITITATVAPGKVGKEKITGETDFTITGSDGSVVPCTSVTLLSGTGTTRCKIAKGTLLASASPYTVVANYGGSTTGTFGPSTGSLSVSLTPTSTRVKIALDAAPTDGNPTTVTATIVDGPATPLLSGNVVFTISSELHAQGINVTCNGTKGGADNVQPLVGQVATCNLPAGWVKLPKLSNTDPRPSTAWSVSAVYNGNASFTTSFKTKKGIVK